MSLHNLIEWPDLKLDFSLSPKTEAKVELAPGVLPLDVPHVGPFVRTSEGHLLCVSNQTAYLSTSPGHWQPFVLFNDSQFSVNNSHSLLCTAQGVLILSFINTAQRHFNWRKRTNLPTKNCFAHHYMVRSEDGGRTWQAPTLLQKGYAAVTSSIIQLKSGQIVVAAQNLDYQAGRHYSLSFQSDDEGLTWQASNKLDIGGQGHHAGCYEGTLVELKDGRVWFCLRTNRDYFWHAYSDNQGLNWTQIQPGLVASSSPAMLKRTASGRLMMVYNPLTPIDETKLVRRGGQFSEVAASWYRAALVVIFSDDDGATWTAPFVLAHCAKSWLAYPHIFEVSDGVFWVTTMQSQLKIQFNEADCPN